jgi:hypothetical protein
MKLFGALLKELFPTWSCNRRCELSLCAEFAASSASKMLIEQSRLPRCIPWAGLHRSILSVPSSRAGIIPLGGLFCKTR